MAPTLFPVLSCIALCGMCAAQTGVQQTALRGSFAKTDALHSTQHAARLFRVGSGAGDAAATTTSDLETADSSTTDDSEASQAVPAETEQADEAGSSAVGPIDKSSMSIDAIVAYCREKDA